MSRPKYFIKTEVMVYGGRTKYYVVKGFSDDDQIAKVGSERDATKLCEEFERLTDENARLKAEVERLTEALKDEQAVAAHRADVIEKLRKAGDAMRWLIECQNDDAYYGHNEEHAEAVKAWNAAKEGKPSV